MHTGQLKFHNDFQFSFHIFPSFFLTVFDGLILHKMMMIFLGQPGDQKLPLDKPGIESRFPDFQLAVLPMDHSDPLSTTESSRLLVNLPENCGQHLVK